MKAYLLVDVDDLVDRLEKSNLHFDLNDVAKTLRSGATLAAGLSSPDDLICVAVGDWNRRHAKPGRVGHSIQQIFNTQLYDIFNVPERAFVADALYINYFAAEEDPVDELILVTTQRTFASLAQRVTLSRYGRVRIWGDEEADIDIEGAIFQPLETVLGVPNKRASLYIDFENITIGLNEQGYIIDLDTLVEGMLRQTRAHGQINRMAAYAPWGQRGSLPPLVDAQGREISDEAPSRLALANIDPVFNLPGKNSADMRIVRDVMDESSSPDGADIFIVASGDRDFNEIFGTLRGKGKQVVVWGIHGSTSRILENNPALLLEYIDDFIQFQRHTDLEQIYQDAMTDEKGEPLAFRPSQWSSVVLQCDILAAKHPSSPLTADDLTDHLLEVHTITSPARGEELLSQAQALGLINITPDGLVTLNANHSITQTTRLLRDRIVHRVANTLSVRNWDYVNYGFLLKGLTMDPELHGPGLNIDDNWRSEWIDALVREGILVRELVPHPNNPEDLVPVIHLPSSIPAHDSDNPATGMEAPSDEQIDDMMRRIVVSVEQFTSFRGFEWCPLGSLHKRLRPYDPGTSFQEAIEVLVDNDAVAIDEYQNPQSVYQTKGISLNYDSRIAREILQERDQVIRGLLELYQQRTPITRKAISEITGLDPKHCRTWISIMELENVLNLVPGHHDLYSLFRTHHTVTRVAEKFNYD
ncbi:MAG: NYN domain-containing protein [Chloroflexi bacterium]|nr:NYN domain-containing protein [Chloroflexota bacterium]